MIYQTEEEAREKEWLTSMVVNIAMKHGVEAEFNSDNKIILKFNKANASEAFCEIERSFLRIHSKKP
ncbi:hypothetical protein KAR28_03965 [Candidatus Parcubacteria bacterium]|nr:hypothetical protein [Candidatus Parcubacteria bacterium]